MEARGLLFGGRGGLESLRVRGEVLAAVGGVEAFWKDDQRGSSFGGFEDAGAGAGKVGGFVGAYGVRVSEKGGGGCGGGGEVGRTCLLRAARERALGVSSGGAPLSLDNSLLCKGE